MLYHRAFCSLFLHIRHSSIRHGRRRQKENLACSDGRVRHRGRKQTLHARCARLSRMNVGRRVDDIRRTRHRQHRRRDISGGARYNWRCLLISRIFWVRGRIGGSGRMGGLEQITSNKHSAAQENVSDMRDSRAGILPQCGIRGQHGIMKSAAWTLAAAPA